MDTSTKVQIAEVEKARAIGARLRAARLDAGLTVADVSQSLRISKVFIRALEAGEFDHLPGPTYVAGYIRSYGTLAGLETSAIDTLVSDYYAGLDQGAARPTYSFPAQSQRSPRAGAIAASIAILLGIGGYAGWYLIDRPAPEAGSGTGSETAAMMAEVETTVTEGDPLIGGVESGDALVIDAGTAAPLAATSGSVQTQVSDEESPLLSPGGDRQATQIASVEKQGDAVLPVDAVQGMTGAGGDEVAGLVPAVTSGEPEKVLDLGSGSETLPAGLSGERKPDGGSAIANQRDPDTEITIRALASSWVEIVRNDGEEVMTRLMRSGDSYLVNGDESLYLSTGNAGGLEFVFSDGSVSTVGAVGEIVRDLPLDINKLRAKL